MTRTNLYAGLLGIKKIFNNNNFNNNNDNKFNNNNDNKFNNNNDNK